MGRHYAAPLPSFFVDQLKTDRAAHLLWCLLE